MGNNNPSEDGDDGDSELRDTIEYGTLKDKQARHSRKLERTIIAYKNADIPEKDRVILDDFRKKLVKEQMTENRFCDGRIATHLRQARLSSEDLPGVLDRLVNGTEKEIEDAIDDVKTNCNEERELMDSTIGGYVQTLQMIGGLLHEETPQPFEELEPRSWFDEDPTPASTNIVKWEEAIEMAETRKHLRNQAMILSEYGGGFRPESELWELQFKHLEDCGSYIKISVPQDAKTGDRNIKLFPGSAILRKWWKEEHPAHDDDEPGPNPETYVWTHLNSNEPLGYSQIKRIFRKAGKAAEITKTHTGQHFRRSRASRLAKRKEINHIDLHNYFGWSRQSDAPIHYIAAFSEDTQSHIAAADGAMVELEEPEPIAPVPCPDCEEWTERGLSECLHCPCELAEVEYDDDLVAVNKEDETDLLSLIMDGEVSARDLVGAKKLEKVIRTRRRFWDEADQLIELAKRNEQGTITPQGATIVTVYMLIVLSAIVALNTL